MRDLSPYSATTRWCSNNLLASFATQAYFYRRMTDDSSSLEYETAALDRLFGTHPWEAPR